MIATVAWVALTVATLAPGLAQECWPRARRLRQMEREESCGYHFRRLRRITASLLVLSLVFLLAAVLTGPWWLVPAWAAIAWIDFCDWTRDRAEADRRKNGHYVEPD